MHGALATAVRPETSESARTRWLTIGREGSVLDQADLQITGTAIQVTVVAPFGHPLGPYDVTVANPGGSWNTDTGAADNCAGCYEVTAT